MTVYILYDKFSWRGVNAITVKKFSAGRKFSVRCRVNVASVFFLRFTLLETTRV